MTILTIFIGLNAMPATAAWAAETGQAYELQSANGSDEQQVPKYMPDLNYYFSNIDELIGVQTINAVKQIQNYYNSTEDDIMVAPTTYELTDQAGPTPLTAITPSRSGRSRASFYNNSQDLEYLARTVYGEARGESFEGQVAVAAVVLNRLESGNFGSSVHEVIFQRGAFTAVSDGQYYLSPNDSAYEAARAALNGSDPTNGAIYYWNPRIATSRWVRTRTIISSIGNHVFAI